jgi:hypothetical protein|tara:strand:- start:1674 stop:1955 length:282 start_codon:yes stop_codon:yes gene_type:complete
MMSDEARLERIEKKLDDMGEAIICLARIEERMITVFKRIEGIEEGATYIGQRMNTLERMQLINGQVIRFVERIFWIVATAAATYFIVHSGTAL